MNTSLPPLTPSLGTVFVVEDDPSISERLRADLSYEGYRPVLCQDDSAAVATAQSLQPDLMVLDLMLSGRSGLEICIELRNGGAAFPIVLLTSTPQQADKVRGLDCGATDYVAKPFGRAEFLARVRAHIGTDSQKSDSQLPRVGCMVFKNLTLDERNLTVIKDRFPISLTRKEFVLVRVLMEANSKTVSRDSFLDQGWSDVVVTRRTIDTHMSTLRHKLGRGPGGQTYIETVRGVGYRLNLQA